MTSTMILFLQLERCYMMQTNTTRLLVNSYAHRNNSAYKAVSNALVYKRCDVGGMLDTIA